MEKQQVNQTVRKPAASDSRKNCLFVVLMLCLLMGVSLAVSGALLGGSLSRFSQTDANVILLVPAKDTRMGSTEGKTVYFTPKAKETAAAGGSAASPRNSGVPAGRSGGYKGDLEVFDDRQAWGSETQVDLFRTGYDGTVVSGDGEKVIAPGTSNFYGFSLKNNGNIPLDYTVSLKVEALMEAQDKGFAIPLEWRMLDGEKTAVTDWREYNDREETLKEATLEVRNQDNYTIEWRWAFERGEGMDRTDTALGDEAAERLRGVKATITVFAEQSADWEAPKSPGGWGLPKTGDPFNLPLCLAVLAVSACGLLILFAAVRRKKDEDEKDGGKKK